MRTCTIRRRRRAFSMIETVMSVVMVGGVFLAALNTAGAAAASRREQVFRAEGLLVAQDLMAEILQQAYDEPGGSVVLLGIDLTNLLGLDAGELLGNGNRTNYDDVDDYNGWSGAPQTKAGVAIAWASRYSVSVSVKPVQLDKVWKTSLLETGVKRVVVTVSRGGKAVAKLTAYRSRSWGGRVEN
jgi:type II secretory pathway pseudopilin PulG